MSLSLALISIKGGESLPSLSLSAGMARVSLSYSFRASLDFSYRFDSFPFLLQPRLMYFSFPSVKDVLRACCMLRFIFVK